MRILSIHLKNIKSHRDLELSFSPGINVLSGPNGVGKSTVFEAIGYALFGVDAQSFVGNVERFISIGAKKGEIEVVFTISDEERFRVTRTVGSPSKWLLAREVGGEFEVEEHKDIRETEVRIAGLLGLDNGRPLAEQFELVIGPFQNEFLGPFVTRQPTRRRDKFDEILGIDTWRKTFTETNVLLKTIKGRVEVLESAIGPLREQVADLPEKREAQKIVKQELALGEKEFNEKARELKRLEGQLRELDGSEKTVKELSVKIDELKVRIDNGKEKIASQKALIGEAEKAQKVVTENTAGKKAYEQAEQRLGELRLREKLQRQLEKEAAALDKRLSTMVASHDAENKAIERASQELVAEKQELAQKREELAVDEAVQKQATLLPAIRERIKGVRTQLGQLEGRHAGLEEGSEKLAEGICPFFKEPCLNIAKKPPGDVFSAKFTELAVARKKLEKKLTGLEQVEGEAVEASEQLKAFGVQLKALDGQAVKLAAKGEELLARSAGLERGRKEQEQLRQQLTEKQAALKVYATLQADIESAEAEVRKHKAARDLYMANLEQAAKLEGLGGDLRKFEDFLEKLREEKKGKKVELTAASREYDASRHQFLREQKDALGREVGALGQKVEGLKADVARLAGEIDKLRRIERDIAAKREQIKAFGEREALVKFLRNRVFRNVSNYLSERFREEISLRADRIYRTIAEVDEELCWGENYRIELRDMVDGEVRIRVDDQLSGGQTMSAVVALRLALLQTIGARVAFFDEPTSNLDAVRRENLAHAFRAIDVGKEEVTEHWYDQLFLVSHDVAFAEITDQMISLGD